MATAVNEPSGPPTTKSASKKVPEGAQLIPMNLEDEEERKLLYDQRIICDWGKEHIPKWRKAMARNERAFLWITLPISQRKDDIPTLHTASGEGILPIGHLALDRVDDPAPEIEPDPTVAAPDGSVLAISSLFVLPVYQSFGIGAWAMDRAETLAQQEPHGSTNCRAVTVTTLAERYHKGSWDDPDGRGIWKRAGREPLGRSNVWWYEQKGYKPYKEEIRYYSNAPSGERLKWYAVFMKKELGDGKKN